MPRRLPAIPAPSVLAEMDFHGLLDEMPVGVAMLDGERRTLFLNRALELLTGFGRDEVRGIPARHVLRLGVREPAQPVPPERTRSLETDILNRHRHKLPVRLTTIPVRGADGALLFQLEIVEDLSLLKEMELRAADAAGTGDLLGRGQAMEAVKRVLPIIADSDAPVLITGETGTGKDVAALALHRASRRSREPFVRVSCGPLPQGLLEIELFGQAGGDAGGEPKPGRFQQASGGTLYFSEIGDLPLEQQFKLVRYLDEQVIQPAGSTEAVRVNVRIIASSQRDPEALVREGRLREDLYHRLNFARLHLPPLRERGEDAEFLLDHFRAHFAERFRKNLTGFSPEARRLLARHAYPGNVRELKNIVEYAAMLAPGEVIEAGDLPVHVLTAAEARGQDDRKPRAARGRKA